MGSERYSGAISDETISALISHFVLFIRSILFMAHLCVN